MNWPSTVCRVSRLIGKRDEWCRSRNPGGAIHPLLVREHIDAMRYMGCTDKTPSLLTDTRWRPQGVPVRVVREEQPGLSNARKRGDASRRPPLYRYGQPGRALWRALRQRMARGGNHSLPLDMNAICFPGYLQGWAAR